MDVVLPRPILFLITVGWTSLSLCAEFPRSAPRLVLDWPERWELQNPHIKNGVWYLNGRLREDVSIKQRLRLTIIPVESKQELVDIAAIRGLVQRLSFVAGSEMHEFPERTGFYFVTRVREKSGSHTHRIEGVLYCEGFLVQLLLDTDDPISTDTARILEAVANARIN
jgi:hypothetical protein